MSRVGLPILTYHAIDTSKSSIATDPSWFADSMALLHDHGYRTVDLPQWIESGRPVRPNHFAITFDDGLRSILPGLDLLLRLRFHASIFVVTRRAGTDNAWPGQPVGIPTAPLLSWSELSDLADQGFSVASHTQTHVVLNALSDTELARELRDSRSEIESRLGRSCPLFAYPYGIASRRVRSAASRTYRAAFGTYPRHARPYEDVHAISRFDSHDLRTESRLLRVLRGELPRDLPLRGAVRYIRKIALNWQTARARGTFATNPYSATLTGA